MFYYLLYPLKDTLFFFNIFRYITFRAIWASVTAFLISIFLFPLVTKWLGQLSVLNSVDRKFAEKIHAFFANKKTVPTMGGLLIVFSILVSNLFWGDLTNRYLLIALGVTVLFGLVGFLDDYLKMRSGSSRGLPGRVKLAGQLVVGLVLGIYLFLDAGFSKELYVPFFKDVVVPLGVGLVPFTIVVLAGTSNALNLTDGLDGLAIGCLSFAAGAFSILSYLAGRADFAPYLGIPFVNGSGELTVFCASLVGASVGFLWYNSYPATIMMGDTGSLALGGALGVTAILIKQELVLLVVGGVYVWEALSVILQVVSFQLFKKRIFRMSPYHHHLQLKGIPESKVTVRLWIVAFILALIGLSTLKLR